ncbi:tail fiber domain-containing protein [Lonsdalea quercina]|uniref:tail fiber domain-containing protein n=1 Tax=Lonsdalea quercina TaxID=71657 RepID=UPI003974F5F5
MSSGTIALTNNSTAVTGTSTSFSSDLTPGDYIVTVVGGVTYTLPVKTVDSDTQVTLIKAHDGPTTSGAAWNAVPRDTMSAITAQLAAETAKALRGLNYDKANWQQVFSGSGNITVTLPDGSSYNGPSWDYVSSQYESKADKSDPRFSTTSGTYTVKQSVTSSSEIQGGMISLINEATNDDVLIWQSLTLSDGSATGSKLAISPTWAGGRKFFFLEGHTGNGVASNGSWVSSSDRRIKTDISVIENALPAVIRSFNGCTYLKDGVPSIGLIAQDVEKECPSAVLNIGTVQLSSGEEVTDTRALDTAGIAAAYHTEAIKSLFELVDLSLNDPEKAKEKIEEIKIMISSNNVS